MFIQTQLKCLSSDRRGIGTGLIMVLGNRNHLVCDKVAGHVDQHPLFIGEGKGYHQWPFLEVDLDRVRRLKDMRQFLGYFVCWLDLTQAMATGT